MLTKEELVAATTDELEQMARENAEKVGFDIEKEPHGLFRALMAVMSEPGTIQEAARRAQAKLE